MSCCGQKRDAVAADAHAASAAGQYQVQPRVAPARAGLAATAHSPSPDRSLTVTLRCRSRSAAIVRGPQTGNRYQFTGGGSMQAVDRRDAEAMVATGLFEKVWG
jgi:hypothetical protein